MGVKTTINLRSFHTDYFYLRNLPLKDYHIWMKAWHPEMEDVKQFLRLYAWSKIMGEVPIFIHCAHGSDRTGTMVAAYRVRIQDWPKEDAIKEMVEGSFGFHQIWEGILPDFIKNL